MDNLPKHNIDPFAPTDISTLNLNEDLPNPLIEKKTKVKRMDRRKYGFAVVLDLFLIALIVIYGIKPAQRIIEPLISGNPLQSLTEGKKGYEVFGFAPFWTFNKLDNVDFETLTTLSYFGVEVSEEGELDREGNGYKTFMSKKATEVFKKAHLHGTRVVLTLTQMKNEPIRALMDNPEGQERAITQAVEMVKDRGIDGINVDFEYSGNPGSEYRDKFSLFVKNITERMHQEIPESKVTVSVYASSVKDPKIYNISSIANSSDGIFMMAYDFAVASSSNAIPTSPLYGYKEGKYWYDVSTAVEHFLTQMPSDKLILGVPWYGYNWAVEKPEVKTATSKGYYTYYKKGRRTYSQFIPFKSYAQTYSIVSNDVTADTSGISNYQEGFDELGKVSWKAYYSEEAGTWRMVFIDDVKSLQAKYDFAKDKNLKGVGMWALGFDDGKGEMWTLLKDKFGIKDFADRTIVNKQISEP